MRFRPLIGGLVLLGAALPVLGWYLVRETRQLDLEVIRLEGRVHTREMDLRQTLRDLGVVRGANLLTIDPGMVRDRLARFPWVRDLRVSRVFPDTLSIRLEEKSAVCLGQRDGQLVLLDEYGHYIKPMEPDDPMRLPVVSRRGGPLESGEIVALMNSLGQHPWLRDRLSEAVGMPGDRWTLYTREGVRILFSKRMEAEMGLLRQLQDRYRILDRQVRQVDLRVSGQAAVRPLDAKASSWPVDQRAVSGAGKPPAKAVGREPEAGHRDVIAAVKAVFPTVMA
ncbi:MAG: FtsQ-type POTRA domain-containing protein [Magnetococcales bacterium]|nr:FtsQ-type POTRA domain-containing protein [Magnetococcales bacterium]